MKSLGQIDLDIPSPQKRFHNRIVHDFHIRSQYMAFSRKMILASLFALLLVPRISFGDKGIILVGPMVHWDFGNHSNGFSYGIESSYWNFLHGIWPYGFDLGLEYGYSHFRLYSE